MEDLENFESDQPRPYCWTGVCVPPLGYGVITLAVPGTGERTTYMAVGLIALRPDG